MLPALIVGGLTAWYLGLRLGIVVAVITAAALLVAMVVPGLTITVYALVALWAAALYFFGPKIAKASGRSTWMRDVSGGVGQARDWVRKLTGGSGSR